MFQRRIRKALLRQRPRQTLSNFLAVGGTLFVGCAAQIYASGIATNLPRVVCGDPKALAANKAALQTGNSDLQPTFRHLLDDARAALQDEPPSVMDKRRVPPSGDKHDFISQAPYYWKNTNSPEGGYIHRDGERNPAAATDSDARDLGKVCSDVHTLALAYYFTDDEKYAAKAAQFLRVWFLAPATRMNPNLNFGQGIPGRVTGRPEGIISSRGLVGVVDALGLLAGSKSWTAADQRGMEAWCKDYLNWLTASKIGLGEAAAKNNHGTFYDTEVAAIGMFVGQTNLARQVLLQARQKRIARQIEPDGRQPLELRRTLSFNYCLFNLQALLNLASIGQNAGVNLWHYQTADGRSILKALEFMASYANPDHKWPYKQIHRPRRSELGELLMRAAAVYPDRSLVDALKYYPADRLADNLSRLCYKTVLPEANHPPGRN